MEKNSAKNQINYKMKLLFPNFAVFLVYVPISKSQVYFLPIFLHHLPFHHK